jgi:hypothetical protein
MHKDFALAEIGLSWLKVTRAREPFRRSHVPRPMEGSGVHKMRGEDSHPCARTSFLVYGSVHAMVNRARQSHALVCYPSIGYATASEE